MLLQLQQSGTKREATSCAWCDITGLCLHSFADTLEQADDMAIDIPHIWLYLAELLSPVLREGGFSMRELFR